MSNIYTLPTLPGATAPITLISPVNFPPETLHLFSMARDLTSIFQGVLPFNHNFYLIVCCASLKEYVRQSVMHCQSAQIHLAAPFVFIILP